MGNENYSGIGSFVDLAPGGLRRMDRREEYGTNREHASLKNQREKRDQLNEKKFLAQQKKSTPQAKGDE
jgi:lysine 2,3-aminomutase